MSPRCRRQVCLVRVTVMVSVVLGLLSAGPASAGRFVTAIESETFAVGSGDLLAAGCLVREGRGQDHVRTASLQLGLEFGVVPGLQLGLALPAYSDSRGPAGVGAHVSGTALWGVFNLNPPTEEHAGLSVAGSLVEDSDVIEAEFGLVLEEVQLPVVVVMNLGVGRWWPQQGAAGQTTLVGRLGANRTLGEALSVSLESEWRPGYDEILAGPALLWEQPVFWLLAAVQFDLQDGSPRRGPAAHLQFGLHF